MHKHRFAGLLQRWRAVSDRVRSHLSAGVPSQCAICHDWPAHALCDTCIGQFSAPRSRCPRCALTLPTAHTACPGCCAQPLALDRTLAAVPYAYPWIDLLHDFKFRQGIGWAPHLARLMRAQPDIPVLLAEADCLLPMPLADARLRQRGFNQTQLLAQALCARKMRLDVLLRVRDTTAQSALPRAERLRNVRGLYRINPCHANIVQRQHVVLLDDVMTSGATLHAAALAVRAAGATRISALVCARAE